MSHSTQSQKTPHWIDLIFRITYYNEKKHLTQLIDVNHKNNNPIILSVSIPSIHMKNIFNLSDFILQWKKNIFLS